GRRRLGAEARSAGRLEKAAGPAGPADLCRARTAGPALACALGGFTPSPGRTRSALSRLARAAARRVEGADAADQLDRRPVSQGGTDPGVAPAACRLPAARRGARTV